jgi:hypothetical protein
MLTEQQKKDYEDEFNKEFQNNKMLKIIFGETLPRGITEAYCDVYRYMGEQMPHSLIRFYPKLF